MSENWYQPTPYTKQGRSGYTKQFCQLFHIGVN